MTCCGFVPPRTAATMGSLAASSCASTGPFSRSRAIMVASISTCPISSVAMSQDHVPVLDGPAAVPTLEEIAHHDADLSPLAAEDFLQLLRVDGVRTLWSGVVLESLG